MARGEIALGLSLETRSVLDVMGDAFTTADRRSPMGARIVTGNIMLDFEELLLAKRT
jgi:hypothetical protein